jgi:N-methylhydantoinase B
LSRSPRKPPAEDPFRLEVFHHLFASIAEEMGAALMRSAFSPNIKERRDSSCALFDARGRMIAQAAHIPVHLGSVPLCVAAAMEAVDLRPGDAVVLNDPYRGGTHLPDLTLVSPVFLGGARDPLFLAANRAHHADVGGPVPGSMAPQLDVHGEGLRIPPVLLVRGGKLDRGVLELLLANMRVPREREGDLLAQWSANRIAEARLIELSAQYGAGELARRGGQLMDWTQALLAAALRELPGQEVGFCDRLELGSGPPAAIRVKLKRSGSRLVVDLRESDDQVEGPINAPRAVALSAVVYVLRTLLDPSTPTNEGLQRCAKVLTRPGSLVDARYPAAVAAGNVETSQRLVDVLLGALGKLAPERFPAASSGTMSNLTFGGADEQGHPFSYYETLAGGAGASSRGPGAHAVHTHMTNTRNTPIEALENAYPVRVLTYTLRRSSGGAGAHRGGDGLRKRLRFLRSSSIGWVADRQELRPWGQAGGGEGKGGAARFFRPGSAEARALGVRAALTAEPGSELELLTPGGGGYGAPPR